MHTRFVTRSGTAYRRRSPCRQELPGSVRHRPGAPAGRARDRLRRRRRLRTIVGTATVQAYQDRIVKVHHSLLPEFPGPDPVADALQLGVKETGVTIHLINPALEPAPIVSQEALEVRDGEDRHSLTDGSVNSRCSCFPRRCARSSKAGVDDRPEGPKTRRVIGAMTRMLPASRWRRARALPTRRSDRPFRPR
jgi:hypothetical protein